MIVRLATGQPECHGFWKEWFKCYIAGRVLTMDHGVCWIVKPLLWAVSFWLSWLCGHVGLYHVPLENFIRHKEVGDKIEAVLLERGHGIRDHDS